MAYAAVALENKAIIVVVSAVAYIDSHANFKRSNPVRSRRWLLRRPRSFPKEMMHVVFQHSQDVYTELGTQNANFKTVCEDYAKFHVVQNW